MSKRIAVWLAGSLCIACCSIPLLGILSGAMVLGSWALYLENVIAVLLVLAVSGFLLYKYVSRKSAAACRLDCNSNVKKNGSS